MIAMQAARAPASARSRRKDRSWFISNALRPAVDHTAATHNAAKANPTLGTKTPTVGTNIFWSKTVAISKLCDRKRTHPTTMANHIAGRRIQAERMSQVGAILRYRARSNPWYAPQATNVQAEPCH